MTGFAPIGASPLGAAGDDAQVLLIIESAVATNPEATYAHVVTLTDSAVCTNPEPPTVTAISVLDTAVLNDGVQIMSSTTVAEWATFSDATYPYHLFVQDVLERMEGGDRARPSTRSYLEVTDAAVITEVLELSTGYVTLVDSAVITDAVTTTTSTTRLDVADAAVITDTHDVNKSMNVVDAAVIADVHNLYSRSVLDVRAVFVGTSVYAGLPIDQLDVLERAVVVDALSGASSGVVDELDAGYLDDYARTITSGATVYTASVAGFAMSTYAGLSFTSASGGYAGSAAGLYKRSTEDANMELTTGFSDFGASSLKTLSGAYIDGEHTEAMEVDVTADIGGVGRTYTYTQMRRSADAQRSVRCDFGRGFRSNFVSLTIRSSGYAKLRSCDPIVAALTRRV